MDIEQLKKEYLEFFDNFKINLKTGILENFPTQKFATMPYIGSKYATSKFKILFVGQDIGKDETEGFYQDFEERRKNIELDSNFNPHIAGTYCTALFLLKEIYQWEEIWNRHKEYSTYSQATKNILHNVEENPLSFVALTNLHKFVNVKRENRAGDENRKFIKRELEEEILLSEIEILKPNLILFQGKLPSLSTLEKIKTENIEIRLANHPSYRLKNGRKPETYIERFKII